MHLVVQFRDLFVKILLPSLHLCIHLLLDLSQLGCKIRNLLLSVLEVILVLFPDFVADIGQDAKELTVQINLISLRLETLADPVEVLLSCNEGRHIVRLTLHFSKALCQPLQHKNGPLFGDLGDEPFNIILELSGLRLQLILYLEGVQVKQADVAVAWQVRLEVGLVIL